MCAVVVVIQYFRQIFIYVLVVFGVQSYIDTRKSYGLIGIIFVHYYKIVEIVREFIIR